MKRYTAKDIFLMQETANGPFVLYTEVLEMISPLLQFVINHREEIESGKGDFGDLAMLLAMVKE